jgi:hypothetical protein
MGKVTKNLRTSRYLHHGSANPSLRPSAMTMVFPHLRQTITQMLPAHRSLILVLRQSLLDDQAWMRTEHSVIQHQADSERVAPDPRGIALAAGTEVEGTHRGSAVRCSTPTHTLLFEPQSLVVRARRDQVHTVLPHKLRQVTTATKGIDRMD